MKIVNNANRQIVHWQVRDFLNQTRHVCSVGEYDSGNFYHKKIPTDL